MMFLLVFDASRTAPDFGSVRNVGVVPTLAEEQSLSILKNRSSKHLFIGQILTQQLCYTQTTTCSPIRIAWHYICLFQLLL